MAAGLVAVALATEGGAPSAWAVWRDDSAWAARGRALALGLERVGEGWLLASADAHALGQLRLGLMTLDLPGLLEVLDPVAPGVGALRWVGAGQPGGYQLRRGAQPMQGELPFQADWRLALIDEGHGSLAGTVALEAPAASGEDLARGVRWLADHVEIGWEALFPRTAGWVRDHGRLDVRAESGGVELFVALQPERWSRPEERAAARWLGGLGELARLELILAGAAASDAELATLRANTADRSLLLRFRPSGQQAVGRLVGSGQVAVDGLQLEVEGHLGSWSWRPVGSGGRLTLTLEGEPRVAVRGRSAWTGWLAELMNAAFDLEDHAQAFFEGLRRGPDGAPSRLDAASEGSRWQVQGSFLVVENGLLRFALRLVGRAFFPDDAEAASLGEVVRTFCAALAADLRQGLGEGEPAAAESATPLAKEE